MGIYDWIIVCEIGSCGGNFTDVTYMEITSPNYPNNYPNSVYCSWNIAVQRDFVVRIIVLNFNTESGYDTVRIYNDEGGIIRRYVLSL